MPGLGQVVAAMMGYSAAKQASSHPETFGEGEIEGGGLVYAFTAFASLESAALTRAQLRGTHSFSIRFWRISALIASERVGYPCRSAWRSKLREWATRT